MKKGISQEGLKLIACVTMLLDHIGAALLPELYALYPSGLLEHAYTALRTVGRLAFPIYCFLLAEGLHYTKNPKKYGLRLLIGAALAEIPFDLLFFGELTLAHSSVMVTLLLGFGYGRLSGKLESPAGKVLALIPAVLAAELLGTDYGGTGVAIIALFLLTRELPNRKLAQTLGLAVLCRMLGGAAVSLGAFRIPMQMFALFALVPIFCYRGRKRGTGPWIQWGFYLFYPVHMLVLLIVTFL